MSQCEQKNSQQRAQLDSNQRLKLLAAQINWIHIAGYFALRKYEMDFLNPKHLDVIGVPQKKK